LFARALRAALPVRPGELRPLLWSGAYHFCLLLAYYLLRPLRESFGIRGDLENLPWLWTGTSAAMLLASPLFAWLVARQPRRRFLPFTYLFFAANLLVFHAAFTLLPERAGEAGDPHLALGYAFYVWLSVFNLFAVSVFWGFMADVHSLEQGARLFGAVGLGGTLGAIAGSAVPARLVGGFELVGRHFELAPLDLLPLSVVFLVLATLCVVRLARLHGLAGPAPEGAPARAHAAREPGRDVWLGYKLVLRSRYLQLLAGYVLLFTVTSTLLYFEQARIVKASFATGAERTAFFASIDLWTNVLTLATQLFVTGPFLSRVGVRAGLLVVPVLTLFCFGVLALWPVAPILLAVQVARRGLHYAVDRPTRELLYTVLGPEEKYKSKSFLDTFVYRGGDLLGAWFDALLAALGAFVAPIAALVAGTWIAAGALLGRAHLRARDRS
jgi:AAA family ATP:ADP antiporter